MEFQRLGQMRREVLPVVMARVKVKFVGDFARCERAVERRGASFKPKIVVVAAIEIDFHICELSRFRLGDLRSQNAASGGLPKVWPKTRERGEFCATPPRNAGSFSMSAPLCALTAEKRSGWRKARCS